MRWFIIPDYAYNAWGFKWFSVAWLLLYIVILALLLWKGKEETTLLAKAMLIIMLFFLPPIVNCVVLNVSGEQEYSRIAWGLLVVPMIGVGAVLFLYNSEYKKQTVCLLIGLLLLAGSQLSAYFKVPENKYKIPNESIKMIEIMKEKTNSGGRIGITFPIDVDETVSAEEEVYFGMRAYDSCYSYEMIEEGGDMGKYTYVLSNNQSEWFASEKNVWKIVGQTENLILYQKIKP